MTPFSWLQIAVYMALLLLLVKPLGGYMARVYQGERVFLSRLLSPLERLVYRLTRIRPGEEIDWKTYGVCMILFNMAGMLLLYLILRIQDTLPLNPAHLGPVSPELSFNTASSFATNTNWQFYSGETTMSYFSQMLGLATHNFVSAATGMSIMAAVIRGLARHTAQTIGNYWADMTRTVVYILLPLCIILAVILVSQGVVQTFKGPQTVTLLQSTEDASGNTVTGQSIAVGPAASQIAIKQLGTNGGGFFNVNSAHPLENPTPLSNFLEMLALLLIPAALCYTFGRMVGDTRQGWALLTAMTIIFVACLSVTVWSEQGKNAALSGLNVDQTTTLTQPGGNMEDKEVRFGTTNSAIWATVTTAVSNGSVNSMHDAYTPLGGMIPMWLMQLGEIVYGGVGSGLYGMLAFVIVAVFIAGLMIGRTPEYLGKKIETYEMQMAAIIVLMPVLLALLGTAIAAMVSSGHSTVYNAGAHGFSELLYAFSSTANNNGSAFAGLGGNPFLDVLTGIIMLFGRFWSAIPALAIAGSLARKKQVSAGSGTLPTHNGLFIAWLIAVIVIVGALSFFPALSLGPIVEHLMLAGK